MPIEITSYFDEFYVCRENRPEREDPDVETSDRFLANNRPKHRLTANDEKIRQARVSWECMRRRCGAPKHSNYPRYGGRGISVRFKSFAEFYEHIGPPPTPEHSVDRINNDGHYEKGNVRWATRIEQARACRDRAAKYTCCGVSLTLREWSEVTSIPISTLKGRVRRGETIENILAPVRSVA